MYFLRSFHPTIGNLIQNLKLVGIVAFGITFAMCGAVAQAQQREKIPRIGYLGNSSLALERHFVDAFRQGLRDLGYIEGQNILIEYRWAEGRYDRFPEFAAELVRLKVEVFLTAGTPGPLAAKQVTQTIPIVMAVSGDAVGTGLIQSLARPGGNITGLTRMTRDLDGKRLELLEDIVPSLSRVAVLLDPVNPISARGWTEAQQPGKALRLKLEPVEVKAAEEFEAAFAAIARQRPIGLFIIADQFLRAHRTQIVDFATRRSLPAMYPYSEFVDAGVSYRTRPTIPPCSGAPRSTWIRFSKARSRRIYLSSSRRSSSW